MNLLKELEGNGWSTQQAIQTTFPFDPEFYSRYVSSRLGKKNCSQPLILVDSSKYESHISDDWSSAPIGDAYLTEPVYSPHVFHPKINLYASSRSVFFTVSSANLTMAEYCDAVQVGQSGGVQKNWLDDDDRETDELLAVAREVTDFIQQLGDTEWVTGTDAQNYIDHSTEILSWLEKPSIPDRSSLFLSNIKDPLLEQITEHVGNITVAQLHAPFWGSSNAIREIVNLIDPNRVEFIVEDENTNLNVTSLDSVISRDFQLRRLDHADVRWIHAKVLSLHGEWGSACLYGSANMTGAALLADASNGNVEAGILRIEDQPGYFDLATGDVLSDGAFEYSLSGSVEPESISCRKIDYEGWDGKRRQPEIQLLDVRLSGANDRDQSTLHLTVDGIDDLDSAKVTSVAGDVSQQVAIETHSSSGTIDVEMEINSDERPKWASATVQITVPEEGLVSNIRRVTLETQEYYTEFRQISESGGRVGSNELVNAVLFEDETSAANVLHEAYSMLEQRSETVIQQPERESQEEESQQQQEDSDDNKRTWREKRFRTVASASSKQVSTSKLVKQILEYHLEAAAAALDLDDPGIDDIDEVVGHLEAFWNLMDACIVCNLIGVSDNSKINDRCKDVFKHIRDEQVLFDLSRSVTAVVNEIESNSDEMSTEELVELPTWKDLYRVFVVHPAVVMDLENRLGTQLIESAWLLQEVHNAFSESTDHAEKYITQTTVTIEEAERVLDSINDRLSGLGDEIDPIGHGPLAVITFFVLMKEGSDYIKSVVSNPMLSETEKNLLGEWTIQGRDLLSHYGLEHTRLLLATPKYTDVNNAFRLLEELTLK